MAKKSMIIKAAESAKVLTRELYTRCRICGRPHSVT